MILHHCVCVRACLSTQGSKGLSLFYAEVQRNEEGQLKGIEVQRLKDKLGTRQMPTAELLLDGLPAHRVSSTINITYCNKTLSDHLYCTVDQCVK